MKLNPEYVKVASKMIDESPYLKLLGTTTELLDAGHYRCRMELDRKHTNMFGGINGGSECWAARFGDVLVPVVLHA